MAKAWEDIWRIFSDNNDYDKLQNVTFLIEAGGLNYFMKCKKKFPHNLGLQRCLFGTIGFVANQPKLRPKLMSEKLIDSILETIETEQKTDDVSYASYRAMFILAKLIFNGQDEWLLSRPSYNQVCKIMDDSLQKWDINVKFHLNFDNFSQQWGPLVMLKSSNSRHFALWILACATRRTNSK